MDVGLHAFWFQDPASGKILYAAILGQEEVFGLVLYPGSEGLDSYFSLLGTEPELMGLDTVGSQHCLRIIVEDPDALAPQDLGVIRKLGLKFQKARS